MIPPQLGSLLASGGLAPGNIADLKAADGTIRDILLGKTWKHMKLLEN